MRVYEGLVVSNHGEIGHPVHGESRRGKVGREDIGRVAGKRWIRRDYDRLQILLFRGDNEWKRAKTSLNITKRS